MDGTAVARGVDAALGERAEVRAEVRDDEAFAALFAARRAAIVRLAYVLTGDGHLAEEAAADAFAATYPRWKAGKVDDPDAYLRRAVVNQIRGRFRRRATRRRFERRPHVAPDTPASDSGVAERDLIRTALLALPIGQRAVVVLRFLEDRSEAETAAILGISTGTVKSQAARGLEHLRAALGELEPGDR